MDKVPTKQQKTFVDAMANIVNAWLGLWPRQSGKTVARQMLAERILDDDT